MAELSRFRGMKLDEAIQAGLAAVGLVTGAVRVVDEIQHGAERAAAASAANGIAEGDVPLPRVVSKP
jgi:hypothetical protein